MPLPWQHQRRAASNDGDESPAPRAPAFSAELHPLARQFAAFRQGRVDGCPHSLEDTAERFGIDLRFAQTVDTYLAARRRLRISRTGWRASLARGR